MRFFIALEIPPENTQDIFQVQKQIKDIIPSLKVTYPEKLHLTIAFIGDQDDEMKDKLIEVITEAAHDIHPFEVSPGYIDAFPNIHHPQVLWMGVSGEVTNLIILRERIKDGLKALNLPVDERRFTPHITIGKLQNIELNEEQEALLQQLALEKYQPIQISSIKLFESVPNQGFHNHNTLAEIKLI